MGRLRPLLTEANKSKWLSDTVGGDWASKWAQESYQLAKDHAYAGVIDTSPVQTDFLFRDFHGSIDLKCGPSKVYKIDAAYDAQASEVVKEQIAKSAVRLAWLLQKKLK
jgi:S1/P1 Nuclease